MGRRDGVDDLQQKETSLVRLRTPDRSTCSLVTIPTELRRLIADFSLRVTGFDPGRFHVGFVVDKLPLGQFFSASTLIVACH